MITCSPNAPAIARSDPIDEDEDEDCFDGLSALVEVEPLRGEWVGCLKGREVGEASWGLSAESHHHNHLHLHPHSNPTGDLHEQFLFNTWLWMWAGGHAALTTL